MMIILLLLLFLFLLFLFTIVYLFSGKDLVPESAVQVQEADEGGNRPPGHGRPHFGNAAIARRRLAHRHAGQPDTDLAGRRRAPLAADARRRPLPAADEPPLPPARRRPPHHAVASAAPGRRRRRRRRHVARPPSPHGQPSRRWGYRRQSARPAAVATADPAAPAAGHQATADGAATQLPDEHVPAVQLVQHGANAAASGSSHVDTSAALASQAAAAVCHTRRRRAAAAKTAAFT